MIFDENIKEELIDVEIELIGLCFGVSESLGEKAVKSALDNFLVHLCRGLGEDKIIPSMNIEYRKFVISFCNALPSELIDKVMPIVIGWR